MSNEVENNLEADATAAVRALMAAVRETVLDEVDTVINVMPLWGNGHYIDVEHFREKLSHLRPEIGSGRQVGSDSERWTGQERVAQKSTFSNSEITR